MPMKVYLDPSIDINIANIVKERVNEIYKIDWVDHLTEDAHWICLITPETSAKPTFNILFPKLLTHKEKLFIGLLLTHDGKSLNETKLDLLQFILKLFQSKRTVSSEILFNIDDLVYYLEEVAWQYGLVHDESTKHIGIDDSLKIIDKKNKKEEIEYGNQ